MEGLFADDGAIFASIRSDADMQSSIRVPVS